MNKQPPFSIQTLRSNYNELERMDRIVIWSFLFVFTVGVIGAAV